MSEGRLPRGSVPTRELELPRGAVAITDLHLGDEVDARVERFAEFCASLDGTRAFLVLGDLFEVWVGPKQGAESAGGRAVIDALRSASDRGVEVHVIPGNRDALLDRSFARLSGVTLHMEGFVIPAREPLVFVHGDSLCTLDVAYQRMRRTWRNRGIRLLSRHLPLFVTRRIGVAMRRKSESSKAFKLEGEKAIRPEAVAELARQTGAGVVITGHAHVASDRSGPPRHVVVGEWGTPGDVLYVEPDGALRIESS